VKAQEIHHFVEYKPVRQVADRPSNDEAEDDLQDPRCILHLPEDVENSDACYDGDGYEEQGPVCRRQALEHAEGSARVPHVDDVEEPGDDREPMADADMGVDEPLGPLVHKVTG